MKLPDILAPNSGTCRLVVPVQVVSLTSQQISDIHEIKRDRFSPSNISPTIWLIAASSWMRTSIGIIVISVLMLWLNHISTTTVVTANVLGSAAILVLVAHALWEGHILFRTVVLPSVVSTAIEKNAASPALLARCASLAPSSLIPTIESMQSQLIEARTRERLIADFAPEVLLCLDSELTIREANYSTFRYWQFRREELVNRPFAQLTAASSDLEEVRKACEQARSKETQQQCEVAIACAGGDRAYALVQIDWSGKHGLFYCQASDITKRKLLELFRSEYLELITHDLRAPLSNILLGLELIVKQECFNLLNDECRSIFRQSKNNVNQLMNLTEQLLDLEKSDAGLFAIDQDIHALSELVRQAVELVSSAAAGKAIKIERLSIREDLVWADEVRVVQVIVNLLSNAIKHSPRHSTIALSSENLKDNLGEWVEFRIKDQGAGIAVEDQKLLFQRFGIARQGTEGEKATGLGLTICKSVVEAHGGTIGCISTTGEGSTFWFRLRAAKE